MLLMDHDMVTAVDIVEKLPIFLEIQFRLLPQDGNLTLFHHLTKEPKKGWLGKKCDSGGVL